MSPMEVLAYQAEWATKDTAHNLDFIPADRLAWKPAPTAKSALEVANEMGRFARAMIPLLEGGSFGIPNIPPATTLAAAKELLLSTGRDYAQALRAVKTEDLSRPVDLGFGTFPLAQAAGMAVIEFVHHRGQIVYIQTLLGDTQDHFDMAAL
jgi:DinB superfamily